MAWDCDCAWQVDFEEWAPPPPPPLFDLPPPPVPPSLLASPNPGELFCTSNNGFKDTCQAFIVNDAEYQVPETVPSLAVILISAVVLTAAIIITTLLLWRCRRRKRQHQQKVARCAKSVVSNFDLPTLRVQEQIVDEDTAIYDELLTFPTHFRSNHAATIPPAYEMADVKLPCKCTTHPLLNNSHHYVTSPYQCPSHSHPDQDEQEWISDPVYEELASATEDERIDPRRTKDRRKNANNRAHGFMDASCPAGSRRNVWNGTESCDVRETDFFITPSWYASSNVNPPASSASLTSSPTLVRGRLTTKGPVRRGEGGVRAAWRELPNKSTSNGTVSKSKNSYDHNNSAGAPDSVKRATTLYRGICPPEPPPFQTNGDSGESVASNVDGNDQIETNQQQQAYSSPQTLPRYYYYSENDDYGVCNGNAPTGNRKQQRSMAGTTGRRTSQRHLANGRRSARSPPASDDS